MGRAFPVSHQRWTNEFDAKLLAGTGQSLSLLGRGWTRRIGQSLPLGRTAKSADEVLEFASRDGEHPGLSRFHPVGMGNAFGRQQRLPGTGAVLLVPNLVTHLTLKDMEDFVLVMVDVQGR